MPGRTLVNLLASKEGDSASAVLLRSAVHDFLAPLMNFGEVESDIVNSVTTDTASTALAVYKDYGWLATKCICHMLQLIFTADLLPRTAEGSASGARGCIELWALVTDIKSLIVKFAHSTKLARAYEKAWNEHYTGARACRPLKPIYDVPTRWSSTYYLLLRFACMWPVLKHMRSNDLDLGEREWLALRERLVGHAQHLPALLRMLEHIFKWVERFSAMEPSSFLARPAVFVSESKAGSDTLDFFCFFFF